MTVDDVLAEAKRNKVAPAESDAISPANVSEFLRFALGRLLEDLDYEGADQTSGGAVAVRVMASIIIAADELKESMVDTSEEASTLEADPMLAAIERHRSAEQKFADAVREFDSVDDFPQAHHEAAEEAAWALLGPELLTLAGIAGIAALFRYVAELDEITLPETWCAQAFVTLGPVLDRLAAAADDGALIEGRTMQ